MRIVIAPDSFKESLSAGAVADAIAAGIRAALPDAECVTVPFADGGEGTIDALVAATGGSVLTRTVTAPLGAPVEARFGLTGDGATAVIEMAEASGLMLVPADRRDPLTASSFGTGELIRAALDTGAGRLIVGIGGSATNDGGAGMVQALGARLADADGRALGPGGGALADLAAIDLSGLDPRLADTVIEAACDVDAPLTGPRGASAVFGPQKGATPDMVALLDDNLRHFAGVIAAIIGVEVADMPGAGAAGGLGAGLVAFLGARLRPGARLIADALGLDAIIAAADLVITGEGRLDGQTAQGKAPAVVAEIARRHGKPVIAIAGSVSDDAGFDAAFSIVPGPCALDQALAEAEANIRRTAQAVAATLAIGGAIRR